MKIKDVEKRTGITSYNIRFYEKENLLIPKRNPVNGYREYTSGYSFVKSYKNVKDVRYSGFRY